jgi:hypothetical protein
MDYIIILLIIFIIILLVIKTSTNNVFIPSVTKFKPENIPIKYNKDSKDSNSSIDTIRYKIVNGIKTPINPNGNYKNTIRYKIVNGIKTPIISSDDSNDSIRYKIVNGVKTPIRDIKYKIVNGVKIPIISSDESKDSKDSNDSIRYKIVNGVKTPIRDIKYKIVNGVKIPIGSIRYKMINGVKVAMPSSDNDQDNESIINMNFGDSNNYSNKQNSLYNRGNASSSTSSEQSSVTKKQNKTKNVNEVYNISLGASENSSDSYTSEKNDSPIHKEKDYYFLGDPRQTQVYHIYNNIYTLKEAEEECAKRNSKLATSEQLENAYSNGADWCNWGWANDGNAYLPNKNKKCNNKIGLLNGKKIDPFLRLGTNCYGVPK